MGSKIYALHDAAIADRSVMTPYVLVDSLGNEHLSTSCLIIGINT